MGNLNLKDIKSNAILDKNKILAKTFETSKKI